MSWSPQTAQQRDVWDHAQRLGIFTQKQLSAETGLNRDYIGGLVRRWVAAERLQLMEKSKKVKTYCVIPGKFDFRSVREDGSLVRPGTKQGNLWRAIRQVKEFTALDVAVMANTDDIHVTEADAKAYLQMLNRAGYLRVIRKAHPAVGRKARYRLLRDTGPKPPKERRVRAVWDENEQAYKHIEGVS